MKSSGAEFTPKLSGACGGIFLRDRARQGWRARVSMDGFTACHAEKFRCRRSHQHIEIRHQRAAGFTLVEMIAVIVLLSFGLIAGSQLMTMTAQSYRDSSSRSALTQQGKFAIERINRELRDALPGSVRESATGECIEWIPVVAASRYLNLPLLTPSNHFTVMQLNAALTAGNSYYAAVFPINDNAVYDSTPTGNSALPGDALRALSSSAPINAGGESDANTDEIYLDAATTFASDSTTGRIYFVSTPVAICARSDGNLYRLSGYDFVDDAGAVSGGVPLAGNMLLSEGSTAINVFRYNAATLTRNAMINIDLRLHDKGTGETLRLQQTVFMRNTP